MNRKKYLIILPLLFVASFLILPTLPAAAQNTVPLENKLIVPIGTLTSNKVDPSIYVNTLYKWGIGLAALLALGQLVLGGVLYTLSAGSIANRESATGRMKNAVTGLVLLIAGVTILVTINPKLVNLKPADTQKIADEGFAKLIADAEENKVENQALGPSPAAYAAAEERAEFRKAVIGGHERCVAFGYPPPSQGSIDTGIRQEIYSFAIRGAGGLAGANPFAKDDEDAREFIDDTGLSGSYYDFREALREVYEHRNDADKWEYHCYQDAVILGLGYSKEVDSRLFSVVAESLKKLPAEYQINEFLKEDPFGRSSVTSGQLLEQITSALSGYQKNYYNDLKSQIDADANPQEVADFLVARGDIGSSFNIPAANLAILYAKQTFTSEKYQIFKARLIARDVQIINPGISIPN